MLIIVSTKGCAPCKRQKLDLNEAGIAYCTLDAESPEGRQLGATMFPTSYTRRKVGDIWQGSTFVGLTPVKQIKEHLEDLNKR